MATSKVPSEFLPVPENVTKFSSSNEGLVVFCNLRPDQRPQPVSEEEIRLEKLCRHWNSHYVYFPVAKFLANLPSNTRVAMFLQAYGRREYRLVTVVGDISSTYWDVEAYPRVNFELPKGCRVKNALPFNLWGAFILAIAPVNLSAEEFAVFDKHAKRFIQTVKRFGSIQVPTIAQVGIEARKVT